LSVPRSRRVKLKTTDLLISIVLTAGFAATIGQLVERQSYGLAASLSVAFLGVMILGATAEVSRAVRRW
jgi:hypothetical protein